MLVKTNYDKEIESLKQIASHYNNQTVEDALNTVLSIRDSFELKILMVGHFNAGKSSLLNKFIERDDFLLEDQGETTAIAAELRYSETEVGYSYDKQQNKEKIKAGKVYLPSEYDHLTYFLNVKGLQKIEDFVIVDTPGFDTTIDEHTQALANYLKYGVGFIVVIDEEKGGIDASTLSYLYEISQYSDKIAILINKCDKILPEQVEEVKELAKFTLEQNGFDYPVYTISKHDSDIIEKISSVISNIDAQEEYDNVLHDSIISNAKIIRDSLKYIADNQFLDTYELDDIIRLQKRNKELIAKRFMNEKKELLDNIDSDVEGVISEVKIALSGKADEAACAIENGSTQGLQAVIIDTVRPILVKSIKEFSADKVVDVAQSLNISFNNSSDEERGLDDIVLSIGDKIHGIMESGQFPSEKDLGIDGITSSDEETDKKKNGGGTGIYKLITGVLSITTDAIAPWLEIIIILLPDIVAGLKNLFGESNHSKIVKQYEAEIIPRIVNALWPAIKESYTENIETMIALFEEEMENSLSSISKIIEEAQDKKQQSIEKYNEFKNSMKDDVTTLENLMEE